MFKEAYENWRTGGDGSEPAKQDVYSCIWGGGSTACPLTCNELAEYHSRFGWPSDVEVYSDDVESFKAAPDNDNGCDWGSGRPLWGIGRSARNIDRTHVPSVEQFDVIETGLHNYLESLGKSMADSGEVMVGVSGASSTVPSDTLNFVAIISGTTYSPKVFDVVPCDFHNLAHKVAADMQFPSLVRLTDRLSKVSDRKRCINTQTSDEWIFMLVRSLGAMSLHTVDYEVALDIDETLRWSYMKGWTLVGTLWEPGLQQPLLHETVSAGRTRGSAEAAYRHMQSEDPLAPRPRQPQSNRGRGRGRGAQQQRRSRLPKRRRLDDSGDPPVQLALEDGRDDADGDDAAQLGGGAAADASGEHGSGISEGRSTVTRLVSGILCRHHFFKRGTKG